MLGSKENKNTATDEYYSKRSDAANARADNARNAVEALNAERRQQRLLRKEEKRAEREEFKLEVKKAGYHTRNGYHISGFIDGIANATKISKPTLIATFVTGGAFLGSVAAIYAGTVTGNVTLVNASIISLFVSFGTAGPLWGRFLGSLPVASN